MSNAEKQPSAASNPVNSDKAFQDAIARGEISGDVILVDEDGREIKRTVYIGGKRPRTEQV